MMEIKEANLSLISKYMPENCMLIAPDDFTALLAGYVEALEKPYSAAVKIERAVIMDLIESWLKKEENRKRLCLIKNLGT